MASTQKKTKKGKKAPPKPEPPAYNGMARLIGGIVCLLLALCVLVSYFNVDALLLTFIAKALKGTLGCGYYLAAPALLGVAVIQLRHQGRPVILRTTCTLLVPLLAGVLWHLIFCRAAYELGGGLLSLLWKDGQTLDCGGVVAGGLALGSEALVSKVVSIIIFVVLLLAALLGLTACGAPAETGAPTGEIFIYGEEHANAACLDKELALWQTCYGQGMRHLFIEMGAGSTLLLNRWMAAEDDAYWDMVYGACEGTLFHAEVVADFYHQIKETCPDTIFHGFDIEHQYATSGEKARQLLEDEGKTDTDVYREVERSIKQGTMYYRRGADDKADVQRENALATNFCTAFDALGGVSVMAFCGGAHADPNGMDHQTGTVPSMAAQIAAHYGSKVTLTCANLAREEKPELEPLRTDTLTIAGEAYEAAYFGEQDISDWSDYASREFWRVEGGYDAFSAWSATGDQLPEINYPMALHGGEAYAVLYHQPDGGAMWWYGVSTDQTDWNEGTVTVQVTPPQAA